MLSRWSRGDVNSVFYCACTILATCAWWFVVSRFPETRVQFFGTAAQGDQFYTWLAPDLVFAVLVPLGMIATAHKGNLSAPLSWIHFGGQGYSLLSSVTIAFKEPQAYPGMVIMVLSAGSALAIAINRAKWQILWGPFQFRPCEKCGTRQNWFSALQQTSLMWLVFLMVIPLGVAVGEQSLGWTRNWFHYSGQQIASLVVFFVAGALGLQAGWAMAKHGDGTPLPSQGTRKLVTTGPYRWIRNPMALLGVLQGVCVGTYVGSPLIVCYAFLGAIWWEVLVRPLEENHLEKTFGDQYRTYRKHVRCWIPRLAPWSFQEPTQTTSGYEGQTSD